LKLFIFPDTAEKREEPGHLAILTNKASSAVASVHEIAQARERVGQRALCAKSFMRLLLASGHFALIQPYPTERPLMTTKVRQWSTSFRTLVFIDSA